METHTPGWYISCAIPFYRQGQAGATVTRCGEDVTDEYAENAFHWTRDSGNIEADTVWNAAHAGMKSITFAATDIDGDVKISCTLTASSATYGSITVDDDLDASHTPAELDANDVFVIERRIFEGHDQPRQCLRAGKWHIKSSWREAEWQHYGRE